MTEIEIFAGIDGEDGSNIFLPGRVLNPVTGTSKQMLFGKAIAAAHAVIKDRNLTDVAITSQGQYVWADDVATQAMYPETGPLPKAYRSDREGGQTSQPVVAHSAVRCPWDKTRHKVIPFA